MSKYVEKTKAYVVKYHACYLIVIETNLSQKLATFHPVHKS